MCIASRSVFSKNLMSVRTQRGINFWWIFLVQSDRLCFILLFLKMSTKNIEMSGHASDYYIKVRYVKA